MNMITLETMDNNTIWLNYVSPHTHTLGIGLAIVSKMLPMDANIFLKLL